jgi:predicted nucleic acid-binding protein
MTAPVFVDTNILLYAFDDRDPAKRDAARAWRAELWRSRRGRISLQVLSEFYVNAVRLLPQGKGKARAEVRDLLAWSPVVSHAGLIERGWKLQDRYRLSYWDGLVVAAAKVSFCKYFPTEDLQALDEIEVVNPFLAPPGSI